jgi:hypothetical protein
MKRVPDRQLGVPHLMERYDVSRMCIARWRIDPKVNFPEPDLSVHDRDYWLEQQTIVPWERASVAKRVKKKMPPPPKKKAPPALRQRQASRV